VGIQVVALEHGAGDDRDDAVQGLRGGGVDRDDPGVRDRRTQDRHVQHAGQHHVVQVPAGTLDEPVVLLAAHRVADATDRLAGDGRVDDGVGEGHDGCSCFCSGPELVVAETIS
jgi:hypothetical protein